MTPLARLALLLAVGCRLDIPAGLPCDPRGPCPADADESTDGAADGAPAPRCGDMRIRPGVEECDDGNDVDGDGCTTLCSRCDFGAAAAVLPANHHCYARFATTRSYAEARDDCAQRGLELATFQAAGEDAVVLDIREPGGGYNLWFGLSQLETAGTFRWVTEEPLGPTHWEVGEPNGGGDCARTTDAATWEDMTCGDPHQYICEDPGWTIGPDAHAYKVLSASYDWNAAQAACLGLGAHLVTLTSQAEVDVVDGATAFASFWLGARDGGAGYAWVGSEAFAFTAWAPGEPAALGPDACAVWTAAGWVASACTGPARHAVCEID